MADRLADYVAVSERVEQFYAKYETGRIVTTILEHDREQGFILMRAEAYRLPDDAQPAATGHAFEERGQGYVNSTSYIENCETGAAGRALALMGFKVKKSLASREEMEKVERMKGNGKPEPPAEPPPQSGKRGPELTPPETRTSPNPPEPNGKATSAQLRAIGNMTKKMPNTELIEVMKECGCEKQSELSFEQAAQVIQRLQQEI